MRIKCPYCGERSAAEFTYLGDATVTRPDPNGPDAQAAFFDYAYMRDNLRGPTDELWYHGYGCGSWLRVTRDTATHEIHAVMFASEKAGS